MPAFSAKDPNLPSHTGMPTSDLLLSLKPIFSALILPPVPFIVLMLVAVRLGLSARRRSAAVLAVLAAAGLWLSACMGTAVWLQQGIVRPPAPVAPSAVGELTALTPRGQTAIVVLGAGLDLDAPEYGEPVLTKQATVRLHYGLWLARHTGLPLAFSGGVGWAQRSQVSEAEVAARMARDEFRQTLRWQETRSRDTRENARWTVRLLQADGIRHVVLVTHAYHMNRAVRAFREAAGDALRITPAPMGFVYPQERPIMNWVPTTTGYTAVYDLLHELVGWWAGA